MSRPLPEPDRFSDALWRLSRRFAGLPAHGVSPRCILHRLLLGSDGALVCGRGDERTLDCAAGAACSSGKAGPIRTVDRACRRCCLRRRRCRDAVLQVSDFCWWLNGSDPVGFGIISGLSRPAGSITGLDTLVSELAPKRLELLQEVIPHLTRIASLVDL